MKTISGSSTSFLYDGLNPVQEQAGTSIRKLLTGLGVDEYLTRDDGGGARSVLVDALGSTLALVDNIGVVQAEYTYEPFGATTVTGSPGDNTLSFTGREDDGTGLKYYRARYYHAQLQRFISEDPIGFFGGDTNLYAYVLNNPLHYIDPLGLVTRPVPGPVIDPFGTPRGNDTHKGVDFWSPKGACVVASDDGRVIKINAAAAGGRGGNEIIIQTLSGDILVYSHTQTLEGIARNVRVREGQPIGTTDYGSGSARGRPHLHYQWRPRGAKDYEDPMEHLKDADPYPTGVSCSPLSGRKD